jgi:hypothetical protein
MVKLIPPIGDVTQQMDQPAANRFIHIYYTPDTDYHSFLYIYLGTWYQLPLISDNTLTMKVYALSLLSVTPSHPAQAALLGTAQDLASFSFLQRGSIGEFMQFFTKVCAIE